MKVGDLVKMKYAEIVGVVVEKKSNWLRALLKDGKIIRDLTDHWEVISE